MADDDRRDRVESALERLTDAVSQLADGQNRIIATMERLAAVQEQQTAILMEVSRILGEHTARLAGLDSQATSLGRDLSETLGRVRIIGESLATHSHE